MLVSADTTRVRLHFWMRKPIHDRIPHNPYVLVFIDKLAHERKVRKQCADLKLSVLHDRIRYVLGFINCSRHKRKLADKLCDIFFWRDILCDNDSIHAVMALNTIHRLNNDDIERFSQREYILEQLKDIYLKHDLDDPRVLAYCQPVYECKTGSINSAEALMRLKLEKTGIIFPDSFIFLAENRGYIHVLTEIILHKTCQAIRDLTEEGYAIRRISVNMSALELRADDFCNDIERVIHDVGIPFEKVAIELTESHTESDFMIMKEKVEKLNHQGIKFYLDDFGTGYSNMERIMELPFDIIKFDRTMLMACDKDKCSVKMVNSLANMFMDMSYSVLYEGVESDGDEALCKGMSATYLQGYKYSRPIPIDRLKEFLPKAV